MPNSSHSSSSGDIAENDEQRASDLHGNIVFCVVRPNINNPIGYAYFDHQTNILSIGEIDTWLRLQLQVQQIAPGLCVTHGKPGDSCYDAINVDGIPIKAYALSYFTAPACAERVRTSIIEDSLLGWAGRFDFNQASVVCAAGGQLLHLNVHTGVRQQACRASKTVWCDQMTKHALNIFVKESHPGGASVPKEGFSLYSQLNQTSCSSSARVLRQWVSYPSSDMTVLQHRYDTIDFLLTNPDLQIQQRSSLRYLKDVPRIFANIEMQKAMYTDWLGLVNSVRAMVNISTQIRGISTPRVLPGAQNLVQESIPSVLSSVYHAQTSAIDERVTLKSKKLRINAGLDAQVDETRRLYEALETTLAQVLQDDAAAGMVPGGNKVYYCFMQHVGYQLALEWPDDAPPPHLELHEFQFMNAGQAYYCNIRTEQMNEEQGDILSAMVDAEALVVDQLVEFLLPFKGVLDAFSQEQYKLDVQCGFAIAARDLHYTRPLQATDPVQEISQGRHPLLDVTTENSVSNDLHQNSSLGRVRVITGPNNSGKSVYQQMTGLVAYMAHIGSFVPAQSAKIGICDSFLCQVTTADTVSRQLSTFVTDAAHMSLLLHNVKPGSLVLIDEFGEGTNTHDGIALCASVCKYLSESVHPPRTLLSTHFHEIHNYQQQAESDQLKFYSMHCVPSSSSISSSNSDSNENMNHIQIDNDQELSSLQDINFVYKCTAGWQRHSYGLGCALGAGISPDIVRRAQAVKTAFHHNQRLKSICRVSTTQQVNAHKSLQQDAFTTAKIQYDTDAGVEKQDAQVDKFVNSLHLAQKSVKQE